MLDHSKLRVRHAGAKGFGYSASAASSRPEARVMRPTSRYVYLSEAIRVI